MLRPFTLTLLCAFILISAIPAFAVPAGRSLTFDKAAIGPVEFEGTLHNKAADKGCATCHNPNTFPKMKKGGVTITMAKIYAGEQCGICHNGTDAFAAQGTCNKCHVRK
ncbi:MAG: cytochrome c3 family protein [Desulfuromonas sp.]|jgi:c(7)-type cytochrome triheme protein|nr:cytochrome c3 family protein [Desulfuromonas sp.]